MAGIENNTRNVMSDIFKNFLISKSFYLLRKRSKKYYKFAKKMNI